MLLLIAVILLNAYIFIAFKLFPKFKVNALQAITINYYVCAVTGSIAAGHNFATGTTVMELWFNNALLMGVFLITLFNLISYGTKHHGIAVTSIASKISLGIPVLFSFFLYNEDIGWLKMLGVLLALPAVVLASKTPKTEQVKSVIVPLIIFLASGLMDSYVKYVQHFKLKTQLGQAGFTITGFSVAAILGTIIVGYLVVRGKQKLHYRNIIAGVILGVPNYFSVYYLIRLLDSNWLQSSAAIPVNNIGIVVVSTLLAILVFKETATRQRVWGILLSVISIVLIALSDIYG